MLREKGTGETTGIVIAISRDGIIGASVGDSEAWIVSGDRFDDLTAGQPRKRLGSSKSIFGVDPVVFRRSSFVGSLIVRFSTTGCRLIGGGGGALAMTSAIRSG